MKTKSIPLIIILVFGAISLWSQESKAQCSVTYIANEGFLIETKTGKIIVDALFGGIKGNWCDQPDDSIANLMLNGLPPFDNIDIVLVTHGHSDHFNEAMSMKFLNNNPNVKLVCPYQINEKLKNNSSYVKVKNNIISIGSTVPNDTILHFGKMNLRVLRLNHGSYFEKDSTGQMVDLHAGVENLGYIIDLDEFKLMHIGDGSPSTNKKLFTDYGIGDVVFDIVMLDRVFLGREGQELLNETIHSNNIVFMHIEPARLEYYKSIIKNIPEMMIFSKTMENKAFVK